jgi:S-adenosylmethionine decarboxylase
MFEWLSTYVVDEKYYGEWEESNKINEILLSHQFTIKDKVFHKFSNGAYTIVVILGESHCVLHTYPEDNIVYVNVFSCKDNLDVGLLSEQVGEMIGGRITQSHWISRHV